MEEEVKVKSKGGGWRWMKRNTKKINKYGEGERSKEEHPGIQTLERGSPRCVRPTIGGIQRANFQVELARSSEANKDPKGKTGRR